MVRSSHAVNPLPFRIMRRSLKPILGRTRMLKVEGLTVNYGAITALRDVDLEVREGEIVTFLGSNGAGKTTLMRTLSALKSATRGKASFYGQDLLKLPSHRIVKLGISQS